MPVGVKNYLSSLYSDFDVCAYRCSRGMYNCRVIRSLDISSSDPNWRVPRSLLGPRSKRPLLEYLEGGRRDAPGVIGVILWASFNSE